MSASVALVCGGRDAGRLVMVRCDLEAGCGAHVEYSDRAGYLEAGNAGWRRVGEGPQAKHFCPAHAAANVPA